MLQKQLGQKIGIFGLGKTGLSVFKALDHNAIAYDDFEPSRTNFMDQFGPEKIVNISDEKWQDLDRIVLSPGLNPTHRIFKLAKDYDIEITSDIDLLFEENTEAKFIGITGTNGKSTTTALISHILKANNLDFPCGGNIGIPALNLPMDSKGYVLELSSFQLDLSKSLRLDLGILLNITPDHLDRYNTIENYIASKMQIFDLLRAKAPCIIGIDNAITKNIAENVPHAIKISSEIKGSNIISCLDGELSDNVFDQNVVTIPENKFLQGSHNHENIAAAYAACRYLEVKQEGIIEALASFVGLPHRMQYLGKINNISFYNDSKATNAEAAEKSIKTLDKIYWLAGGIAKEGGIEMLSPLFHKIQKAYLFGQDKEIFAKTLKHRVDYVICDNLKEAFTKAVLDAVAETDANRPLRKLACEDEMLGDLGAEPQVVLNIHEDSSKKSTQQFASQVEFPKRSNVLLAPAAASYDQFKNFEHRGELFIELYNEAALKKV
jgi:UDP-N-acetylmuramoylalanine--D-glutamate ligase